MRELSSIWKTLAMALSLGVAACATSKPAPPPPVAAPQDKPPAVQGPSGDRPSPVTGWVPAYDAHIKAEAAKKPKLLALSAADMAKICPAWGGLDETARIQFYADFLYAVTRPESDYDRRSMMYEGDATNIDAITGHQQLSEGLLQLSYSDMQSYRPKQTYGETSADCAWDWPADQAALEADIAANPGKKSFKSSHPERSILNPYRNLSCGVFILNRLISFGGERDALTRWGAYWSTMRPSLGSFAKVRAQLASRNSPCVPQ